MQVPYYVRGFIRFLLRFGFFYLERCKSNFLISIRGYWNCYNMVIGSLMVRHHRGNPLLGQNISGGKNNAMRGIGCLCLGALHYSSIYLIRIKLRDYLHSYSKNNEISTFTWLWLKCRYFLSIKKCRIILWWGWFVLLKIVPKIISTMGSTWHVFFRGWKKHRKSERATYITLPISKDISVLQYSYCTSPTTRLSMLYTNLKDGISCFFLKDHVKFYTSVFLIVNI